jgi:hypothetical protein
MTDIVERLRHSVTKGQEPTDDLAIEAADEIERLRAALTTYTAANGEELPKGSAGTTIVNDGRPT